jgi:micrococcal nuclease
VRLQSRPLLLVIALALVAAGCSDSGSTTATTDTTAATGTTTTGSGRESAVVAFVNDGDTLRTTSGKKIRLLQIDAPELHGDCFGKAALSALRQLTPKGTPITLVRDPSLDQTDRYGRLLRYVLVHETNVNIALVQGGTASPYFFRNERGLYASELLAAVEKARAEKLGYWGACPKAKLNTGLGSITGRG